VKEVHAYVRAMTLIWFVVWLLATLIGDNEVLTFDPVKRELGSDCLQILAFRPLPDLKS
jgi:hypothetical protein